MLDFLTYLVCMWFGVGVGVLTVSLCLMSGDNRDEIVKYQRIERVKHTESKLNERIRMIERSNMDPAVKKELRRRYPRHEWR